MLWRAVRAVRVLHVLWRDVACCGVLWRAVACYGVLWRAVVCCGVLWRAVVCCGVLWVLWCAVRYTPHRCSMHPMKRLPFSLTSRVSFSLT